MDFKYLIFDTIPNDILMDGIVELYNAIFGSSTEDLIIQMKDKPKLVFNIALKGDVGFKIGYELDENKYYSWLGAVDTTYRKRGIASKLMELLTVNN